MSERSLLHSQFVCTILINTDERIDRGCAIKLRHLFTIGLLLLVAAGCRRIEAAPTVVPTLSPTPRSTALPALPTAVPIGSEANPLRMLVVSGESTDVEAQAALASTLGELTGLNIEIATVARPADALATLCASISDQVSIAWLDGLTALAAQAQDCGDPTLTAERRVDDALSASETIQIITSRQAASFAALSGQAFCRVSSTDLTTWLYPSILMRANDFDVIRDSSEPVDVADVSALITGVIEGDCDAAGIPTSALANLDPNIRGELTLLEPTLDVLQSVLVYPQAVTLTSRDAINSAFGNLTGNPEQLALLQSALGIDQVRAIADSDLEPLRTALTAADLDLAQIGR